MICWLCSDQAMRRPPLPSAALGQRRRRSDVMGLPPYSTVIDTASLLTSRADGRAHAAPVGFVVHGGAFWFATAPGLRLRNLEAHAWASLVVMEGTTRNEVVEGRPHVALTAEGPVTLHAIEHWRSLENEWLRRHAHPPTRGKHHPHGPQRSGAAKQAEEALRARLGEDVGEVRVVVPVTPRQWLAPVDALPGYSSGSRSRVSTFSACPSTSVTS